MVGLPRELKVLFGSEYSLHDLPQSRIEALQVGQQMAALGASQQQTVRYVPAAAAASGGDR